MRWFLIIAGVSFLLGLNACGTNELVEASSDITSAANISETSIVSDEKPREGFWLREPDQPVLSSDPKTADEYLVLLDKEVTSYFAELNSREYSSPSEKLLDMVRIDQTMRNMSVRNPVIHSHFADPVERNLYAIGRRDLFNKVDESNTAILKSMLAGRGWFRDDIDGNGSARSAWLIAQHADRDTDFQQDVLTKMEAELGAPGVTKAFYAYLYDRVSLQPVSYNETIKRTQRYGTQGRCNFEKEIWEPLPLEDEDRLDRWRAQMGLEHLDDYRSRFNCNRRVAETK